MMSFAELFHEGKKINPLDNGRFVLSRGEDMLAEAGIELGCRGAIETGPHRDGVVIGVAFYSLPDLELLDRIIAARKVRPAQASEAIIIFDVLGCQSMEDFARLIPGITPVYQTPVIGIWRGGHLVHKETGARARELISSHYGL